MEIKRWIAFGGIVSLIAGPGLLRAAGNHNFDGGAGPGFSVENSVEDMKSPDSAASVPAAAGKPVAATRSCDRSDPAAARQCVIQEINDIYEGGAAVVATLTRAERNKLFRQVETALREISVGDAARAAIAKDKAELDLIVKAGVLTKDEAAEKLAASKKMWYELSRQQMKRLKVVYDLL